MSVNLHEQGGIAQRITNAFSTCGKGPWFYSNDYAVIDLVLNIEVLGSQYVPQDDINAWSNRLFPKTLFRVSLVNICKGQSPIWKVFRVEAAPRVLPQNSSLTWTVLPAFRKTS